MKKFLIGCAIFVAVVLVLGIGGSYVLIKRLAGSFPDQERLEAVEKELVARDGEFESEIMPIDGSIPPEMLDRYVQFREVYSERVRSAAEPLQEFVDDDMSGKGGFRKLLSIARGGFDTARSTVIVSGVADSLLLDTGLTRGEAVYLMALVRYGAGDFVSPFEGADFAAANDDDVRSETMELLEELEKEFTKRAFKLLENQRGELNGLEELDERQAAWLASLNAVLDERPRSLSHLKGRLQPWQLELLEPRLYELREMWPTLAAEYYLDLIPGVDTDDEEEIRIEFGD